MTALKELNIEIRNFSYAEKFSGSDFEKLINKINQKYSVTLRTASESKSKQSTTDKELVGKIKALIEEFDYDLHYQKVMINILSKEILALFKTYKTMPNSASNNPNEVIVNKLEIASEIAHSMLFESVAKEIGFDEEELFNEENYKPEFQDEFNHLYDNALKLIDRCRIGSNSSSNNSVEHSINQEQMMSQIEDVAVKFAENWSTDVLTAEHERKMKFEQFQQELKDCFKQHFKPSKPSNGQTLMEDNSVFQNGIKNSIRSKIGKIVNSSDDLSIIVEKLTEFHMASIEPVFRALDE